jgi:hypothetical protein
MSHGRPGIGWHKAKTCPYDITDVDAVEFNVPPTQPQPRLRAQPKTSYTSGKPVKEKVVPKVTFKVLDKDFRPKKQRLRAQPKTSDTSGKPEKEKKMRILSVKGDDAHEVCIGMS